jgi:hypothetical protein
VSNLDLDRAAEAVAVRLESWADLGITLLAPLTWVDFVAELPAWTTDRSQMRRPKAFVARLQGHEGSLAQVMLYAGGWVDVDLLPSSSSEIEVEYHELDDVEEFATLLDRVASRLVSSA